jgi:hypothetical protein
MKRIAIILVAGFILLAAACSPGGEDDMGKTDALQPGDLAPGFELPGSDGRTYRLEDYQGEQTVVLAWFPKAFTGG